MHVFAASRINSVLLDLHDMIAEDHLLISRSGGRRGRAIATFEHNHRSSNDRKLLQ